VHALKGSEQLRRWVSEGEIILETNATQVVEALLGDEFRQSVLGGMVHELKDLLAEHLFCPK
jgi:hypothetical protein